MKLKLSELVAVIILFGALFYIFGQAGLIDNYEITMWLGMKRMGIAIVVIGLDALWICKHFTDGEWV